MPRIKRTAVPYWTDITESQEPPAAPAPTFDTSSTLSETTMLTGGLRAGQLAIDRVFSMPVNARTLIGRIRIPRDVLIGADFSALEHRIAADMRSASDAMDELSRAFLFGLRYNNAGAFDMEVRPPRGVIVIDSVPKWEAREEQPSQVDVTAAPRAKHLKKYNYFTERAMHGAEKPKPNKLIAALTGRIHDGKIDRGRQAARMGGQQHG